MSAYIFDNAAPQAAQRFTSLEALYDPWTISHLQATGIGQGWQCWEVGAGGGSIAVWLAERCGVTGHVLVTDIDPRFLEGRAALAQPQIEVQRHDIGSDPLPAQAFDLIHARLVLSHVSAREQALGRMVTALKQGGWLLVEEFDPTFIDLSFVTSDAEAGTLFQKMIEAQHRLMAAHSGNLALTWGRSLHQRLRGLGLFKVSMEGYLAIREGNSPGAHLMRANFEQVREEAVQAGYITNDEVEQVLTLLDDANFAISAPVMFTACGRRP